MDTSPNTVSPASTTTLNLDAYMTYTRLYRIASFFLQVTQYPLVSGSTSENSLYRDFVALDSIDAAKFTHFDSSEGSATKLYRPKTYGNYKFNMNLAKPFQMTSRNEYFCPYTIASASELPNDTGLHFPFISELAKPDGHTIPFVIEKYFLHLLGETQDVAMEVFSRIKIDWGVIAGTRWGDELSHLYAGIRLSFETGAMMDCLVTPQSKYSGFVLTGGGFVLKAGGKLYKPVSFEDLQSAFSRASPHQAAVKAFLDLVNFPDDMARQNAISTVKSTYEIGVLVREHGYNIMDIDKMRKAAEGFAFVSDNYLPITGHNISRVLNAMTGSNEAEEKFPLHPIAVLETDKSKRLLSAFGATAPSFLVPNGKSMPLEGSFSYKQSTGKGTVVKTTTRMFAVILDWADACVALSQVLADKHVTSPIGTPVASRASSRSNLREFEGDQGASVLSALRQLAGVNVASGSGGGTGKRGRDDDEDDKDVPDSKKAKIAAAFSFD